MGFYKRDLCHIHLAINTFIIQQYVYVIPYREFNTYSTNYDLQDDLDKTQQAMSACPSKTGL